MRFLYFAALSSGWPTHLAWELETLQPHNMTIPESYLRHLGSLQAPASVKVPVQNYKLPRLRVQNPKPHDTRGEISGLLALSPVEPRFHREVAVSGMRMIFSFFSSSGRA